MAGSVKCILKLNLGVLTKNIIRHTVLNQTRTLFTEQSLGLTGYMATRKNYQNQFIGLEESFRNKMKLYVTDNQPALIFTEDLRVMLHLMEKTPEDIDLIIKMLKKFNSQSSEMRFGSFTFGPIVMRSFHRLNEPDLAIQLFKDPAFFTFFNQLSSYQIFLDLLYKNKKYKEMRDVYDGIKHNLTDGRVHPRNALLLITAACYQENSEESWQYALGLWNDLHRRGYPTVRRVLTHLAALAIKRGQSHLALEMLATAHKPRYISIRCLKIMAFADIDRLDDIIPFFRSALDSDNPSARTEKFFADAIEKVEAAIERTKTSPDSEIVKLLALMKSNDFIQQGQTLDDHINVAINIEMSMSRPRKFSEELRLNNRYSGRPTVVQKPGLRDLV